MEVEQKFVLIPEGNIMHRVPQRTIDDIKGLLSGANTSHYRDRKER